MGFKRPLRKQSGGLFSGRGRIPVQLTASGQDVGSCAALLQNCTRLDTFFKSGISFLCWNDAPNGVLFQLFSLYWILWWHGASPELYFGWEWDIAIVQ